MTRERAFFGYVAVQCVSLPWHFRPIAKYGFDYGVERVIQAGLSIQISGFLDTKRLQCLRLFSERQIDVLLSQIPTKRATYNRYYKWLSADGKELEPPPKSSGDSGVLAESAAESGASTLDFDHELKELAQAWPGLPRAVRAGILALVRTAGEDR